MAIGLDGIERIVVTENPETKKPETYVCAGYYNTSRTVPNTDPTKPDIIIPGKLVDWYRPLSREGQYHSFEYLQLYAKVNETMFVTHVRGTKEFDVYTQESKSL